MSLWSMIAGDPMCENCRVKKKYPGHEYCGKSCAQEGEAKKAAQMQARMAMTRQSLAAGPGSSSAGMSSGRDRDRDDRGGQNSRNSLCEECHKRPKKKDYDHFTRQILIHDFCGSTCRETFQRRQAQEAAAAAAQRREQAMRAAAAAQAPPPPTLGRLNLMPKTPASQSVYQRFIDRWIGPEGGERPKVHAIYRILPSDAAATRLDNILELNEQVAFRTVYYAGQWLCDAAVNKEDAPQLCNWDGCSTCVAIKYQFEKVEFNAPAMNGIYGDGIYSFQSPVDAHPATLAKATYKWRAMIQCRLIQVLPSEETPEWNTIEDDRTGAVFCQKQCIIPTHLIIYAPPAAPEEEDKQ